MTWGLPRDYEWTHGPSAADLEAEEYAPEPRQHGIYLSVPGGWLCSGGCGRRLDDLANVIDPGRYPHV